MNIGQAARASGISARMIRHYESIGLVPLPPRSPGGYRRYDESAVARLRFLKHARAVGFESDEIKKLLSLWQNSRRSARDVKRLAESHLADIEARIEQMRMIAASLSHLVEHCHGEDRPDCPILESLESAEEPANAKRTRRRS
jgi:MerR family copper efflux transcriptional regulator